jgi:hypothetical protein
MLTAVKHLKSTVLRLEAFLRGLGFTDVELRIVGRAGGHSYVLARKEAVTH